MGDNIDIVGLVHMGELTPITLAKMKWDLLVLF